MLSRVVSAVGVAFLLGATTVTTAVAAEPDPKPSTGVGSCSFVEICVGAGVGGSTGSGNAKPSTPSKGTKKPTMPGPCIVTKMDPQPPAGSSAWEGHDPSDGAIYTRICPLAVAGSTAAGGLMGPPETFWSATAPIVAVDPAQLAQQAVDKMTLLGPDIDVNPKPGGKGLVGMPVWMAADQSQTTWGPNTASASAGGVTVNATAKVSKVVWSLGDGATVTCTGPGTVYKKSFGLKKSPDCGHVYTQPSADEAGGTYKVTATSTWVIDWQVAGGGETGQLTEVRNSAVALTIVESQAVNS